MFKRIALILTSILLVIPFTGCKTKEEDIDTSALLNDDTVFSFGELNSFDLDDDGYVDNLVYTFERQEVAEDLFLDKTVQYTDSEDGFMGALVLEFENIGDDPVTYSHIEIIPKSFAESVDDLEFSIPPDEILYPDPVVRWEVKMIEKTVKKILVSTKKAALTAGKQEGEKAAQPSAEEAQKAAVESFSEFSKAVKGDEVNWGKALLGLGRAVITGSEALDVGTEAGIKAGKEAAIDNILDSLDDFSFIAALNICGSAKNRDHCMFRLVKRFRHRFNEDVCKDAFDDNINQKICTAIAKREIGECEKLEKWNDYCKGVVIYIDKCGDIKDKEQLYDCYWEQAVACNCTFICQKLEGDEQILCLVKVTGDKKYCDQIKNPDLRAACLEESDVVEEGKLGLPSFNYANIKVVFDATFKDVDTGEKGQFSGEEVFIVPPEGQYNGKMSGNSFNISWTKKGDDVHYSDNPLYSYVIEGNISVTIDPKTLDVSGFNAKETIKYGSGASSSYSVSGGHCRESGESSISRSFTHSVDEGSWTPQITWSEVPGDPEGPGFRMYELLNADYRHTLIRLEVR